MDLTPFEIESAGELGAAITPGVIINSGASTHSTVPPNFTLKAAHRFYPLRIITKFAHSLPKISPDALEDIPSREEFTHSWKGHHIVADGLKALGPKDMSLGHLAGNLPLDLIKLHGLPVLSDKQIVFLSDLLKVPLQNLLPWNAVTGIDLTVGMSAWAHAGPDLYLAITGHLPWGLHTAAVTFGCGAAEMVSGYVGGSPCLLTAGITEAVAGSVSLWQHYAQPSVFGVPLSDLLHGLGVGSTAGLVCSVTVALIGCKRSSLPIAATNIAQAVGVSGALGALAAISSWASIPTAAGWTLGRLAWKVGKQHHALMRQYRISSPRVFCELLANALHSATPAERTRLVRAFHNDRPSPEFARFLGRHETNGQVTGTKNWNSSAWIESHHADGNWKYGKFLARHARRSSAHKPKYK